MCKFLISYFQILTSLTKCSEVSHKHYFITDFSHLFRNDITSNTLNIISSTFWHQKVEQKVPSDGSFREFGTQENSYTKTRRFTPQTVGVCACGTVLPRFQILSSLPKCSESSDKYHFTTSHYSVCVLCVSFLLVFLDSFNTTQMLGVFGLLLF